MKKHRLQVMDSTGHKWLDVYVTLLFDGSQIVADIVDAPRLKELSATRESRKDKGQKKRTHVDQQRRVEVIVDLAKIWPADRKTNLTEKVLTQISAKHGVSTTLCRQLQYDRT